MKLKYIILIVLLLQFSNSFTTETNTNTNTNTEIRSENKLNSKINTSEKSFQKAFFQFKKSNSEIQELKLKITNNVQSEKKCNNTSSDDPKLEINLGDGPVYYTAWVKYFKYSNVNINNAPKKFFKNDDYEEQIKLFPNADFKKLSSDGINTLYSYIQSPSHFYAVVFANNLNIVTSRHSQLHKTFDVLHIDSMAVVLDDAGYGDNTNGIQDFGNFSEGYCFKIITTSPNYSWVICTEDAGQKLSMMSVIKNLKITKQRASGINISLQQLKSKNPITINEILHPDYVKNKTCKNPSQSLYNNTNLNDTVLTPIVKIMRFSNRKQRYTKCVIKESDLFYTKNYDELENSQYLIKKNLDRLQIPVRVIMNNQTIVIYGGDSYDSQIKSFNLKETEFKRSDIQKTCFILVSNEKNAELCSLSLDNTNSVEEWDYDFNLFKIQCNNHKDMINTENEMNKKLKEKIDNLKIQLLHEREGFLKEHSQNEEENKIKKIIEITNQKAIEALQKELNIEELIQKEEEERERNREKEILERIENEKKKTECIFNAIKERQIENQYNVKSKEIIDKIDNIKQATAQQVLIRRNQLKNKISEMRKKAKRKEDTLTQELFSMRMEMTKTMGKAYKKGNSNNCQEALKSEKDRDNYCLANFAESLEFINSCKREEEFCYICCDNEFGEMFMNDRSKCYNEICKDSKKNGTISSNGKWIWHDIS